MKKWLGTIRVLPAAPETETAVAAEVVSDAELAAHYALACKGNKVRALLMALDAGYDFTRVCGAFGDDGVAIAYNCLLKGWIDQGRITSAGRAVVQKGSEA